MRRLNTNKEVYTMISDSIYIFIIALIFSLASHWGIYFFFGSLLFSITYLGLSLFIPKLELKGAISLIMLFIGAITVFLSSNMDTILFLYSEKLIPITSFLILLLLILIKEVLFKNERKN